MAIVERYKSHLGIDMFIMPSFCDKLHLGIDVSVMPFFVIVLKLVQSFS